MKSILPRNADVACIPGKGKLVALYSAAVRGVSSRGPPEAFVRYDVRFRHDEVRELDCSPGGDLAQIAVPDRLGSRSTDSRQD